MPPAPAGQQEAPAESFFDQLQNAAEQLLDAVRNMSPEERDLLLDAFQFLLDMVGIIDPFGVCDATSGVISGVRGNYLDAGVSIIAIAPLVGDLAKGGKIVLQPVVVGKAAE